METVKQLIIVEIADLNLRYLDIRKERIVLTIM
jgi:hypothetical protein